MGVSTAFGELTELLRCLETSDAVIREVALREQSPEAGDELTADLTLGVPILPGITDIDASVEASGFEVQDQRIDVDVTVTLPVRDDDGNATSQHREYGAARCGASPATQPSSVPSYKDPDALQAVYDEYDTFPEMTEALGADVTSETVRRYMVEYDIHDPATTTPQARALSQSTADVTPQGENERDTTHADATRPEQTNPADTQSTTSESPTAQPSSSEPPTTRSANTHSGTGTQSDTQRDSSPNESPDESDDSGDSDDIGRRSVAEMIAETDSERTNDTLVADGLGIPQNMTVAELADVVNRSNTIYEVTQQLDMKQGNARRLLQKLNLIDFVIHRLAADEINVSHEEIARRIAAHD